jgi:hypothetical protein
VKFRLLMRRLRTRLEVFYVSDASQQARHEFRKSPPCKAGFRISGHLLGGRPFLFDQLHKRLAAVPQALAFLELVEKSHRVARESQGHFLIAGGYLALAISSDVLCDLGSGFHRRGSTRLPVSECPFPKGRCPQIPLPESRLVSEKLSFPCEFRMWKFRRRCVTGPSGRLDSTSDG